MTSPAPTGPIAWFVVLVHDRWRLVLMAMVLLVLLGGVTITAGDDSAPTIEHVGDLVLDVEVPSGAYPPHRAGTDLPNDGVVPRPATARLDVGAYVTGDPQHVHSVDIELVLERTVRGSTLWSTSTVVTEGSSEGVNDQIHLDGALAKARSIDDALDTASGALDVRINAVARGANDRTVGQATIKVVAEEDHLAYEPRVTEALTASRNTEVDVSPGAVATGATGIVGGLVVGAMRATGTVPLSPTTYDRYRCGAARWRYRRHLVDRATAIEVGHAIRVQDPAVVVRIGRDARKPVCVDPTGTFEVTVGEQTFAWWPSR